MRFSPARIPIHLSNLGEPRTSGIHLSGVLRAIAQHTRILKHDNEDLATLIANHDPYTVGSNGLLMRLIIGYAWEDWISRRIPGLVYHPGEIILDGIIMTPDGVHMDEDTGEYVLDEFKATFKSAKKHVSESPMWMWQGAGYLKGLAHKYREPCTRAVYHVLHLRGDYSGIDPMYVATEVEFEPAEIETTWNTVQTNKHLAVAEKGQ